MSLFVEKYRPRVQEEIVGNQKVLDDIFSVVATGNIPHMIFEGPAGVGKTSTALVIARQLFGEFFQSNFLELNASDERGINVVRETVKTFCKTNPLGSVPFKILFLDEADNMTPDALQALRRIMEQYSQVTRFILSANNVEKIIEPIVSRCQVFRFGPISPEDIFHRLNVIATKENLSKGNVEGMLDVLHEIASRSNGDMRRAINKLQVLASYEKGLTLKLLEKVSLKDIGPKILNSLVRGRFLQTRKMVRNYLTMGYTERNLLNLLHNSLINDRKLSPVQKGEAILCLAETDYKLTLGVSKGLQMDALLLRLLKVFMKELEEKSPRK